jgi:hypothetical protein
MARKVSRSAACAVQEKYSDEASYMAASLQRHRERSREKAPGQAGLNEEEDGYAGDTPTRFHCATAQLRALQPYRLIDGTTVQTKMQTVSEGSNVSTTVSAQFVCTWRVI